MLQLTRQQKSGKLEILEVPFPILSRGKVMVRNHFSVISPGTEGAAVSEARKGLLTKVIKRQEQVRLAVERIKSHGLLETYEYFMSKLAAPNAMGYSSAGEVIGVGEDVSNIRVGDWVACAGAGYAVHADVVVVPKNLCVVLPKGLNLKHAAFAAIASVAIQGIRQAELRLGETAVVIGLGLIGQLTIQLLLASGIKPIGIDVREEPIIQTQKYYCPAYLRTQAGLEQIILRSTGELGADAVIITAGSSSEDPINLAGELCRKKGKIIVVGNVRTSFTRKNFYEKELEVRLSCSYGPGRYDPQYEEQGIDYPPAYVRWTENRNMSAFVDLLTAGRLQMDRLMTHLVPLEKAPEAYSMIVDRTENSLGVVIEYDSITPGSRRVETGCHTPVPGRLIVGFIGAGSFAESVLLPNLRGLCDFSGVVTLTAHRSRFVASRYGFQFCTGDPAEIIGNPGTNIIFVATRHDSHAVFVVECLRANKNVFVEKPLAINQQELDAIKQEVERVGSQPSGPVLMAGFNRRFAPFIQTVKSLFQNSQPKAMNFRINAGVLPRSHWTLDPKVGGGRIIGEVCHFLDLALFLAGSKVSRIHATSVPLPDSGPETVCISLSFENGSIATINYFSNGHKSLSKERYEIFCDGTTVVIDDFCSMTIHGSRTRTVRARQDKGHENEIKAFLKAVKHGLPSPIPFEELCLSTELSFAALNSIKENRVIHFQI